MASDSLIDRACGRFAAWLLANPRLVLGGLVASVVLSLVFIPRLRFDFAPQSIYVGNDSQPGVAARAQANRDGGDLGRREPNRFQQLVNLGQQRLPMAAPQLQGTRQSTDPLVEESHRSHRSRSLDCQQHSLSLSRTVAIRRGPARAIRQETPHA